MNGKDVDQGRQENTITDDSDSEDKALETILSVQEGVDFTLAKPPEWISVKQLVACWALSLGVSKTEAAKIADISRSQMYKWLAHEERGPELKAFIGRLVFYTGMASRSVRLALAKKMAMKLYDRELGEGQKRHTALDWLKYAGDLSGDQSLGSGHPAGRLIQQFFKGPTTIQMGESAPAAEVIEGEGWELEDESEAEDLEPEAVQLARGMLLRTESLQSEEEKESQP